MVPYDKMAMYLKIETVANVDRYVDQLRSPARPRRNGSQLSRAIRLTCCVV